jgi:DNA polymerase-1
MRGFAERVAMNTPIQGTSADIIKVAMIAIAEARKKEVWSGEMLVQVHDELLFEIPLDQLAKTSQTLKRFMETALDLSIPIVVDLKQGLNWTEMTPMKKGIS